MPAPTNGLVLFWNMKATNPVDLAGSNDSTASGVATTTPGKINGALTYNGSGDYDYAPNSASIDFGAGTAAFSVSCWASFSDVSRAHMLMAKSSPNPGGKIPFVLYSSSATSITWETYDGTNNPSVTSRKFPGGQWNHFVGRRYAGNLFVTVNAGTRSSVTDTNTGATTSTRFTVGKVLFGGERYWLGDVDEVRLYNRYITNSEVSDIYNDTTAYPVAAVAKRKDTGDRLPTIYSMLWKSGRRGT